MEPTIFGALVLAIGAVLMLWGSLQALILFVLLLTLLGGSSAITLTVLGNSSIQPANLAVCFLIVRYLLPGRSRGDDVIAGIKANAALVCFVLYGVAGAYLLPRIFAGSMYVTPLHPNPTRDPFASEPLKFTNQNITISVYMLQTMLAAIGATVVARRRLAAGAAAASRALSALAITTAIICLVHAALGILSVVAKEPLAGMFAFFRNSTYAQLDQEVGAYARMNGIFPEPSNYAAYGFAWQVLATELWLRGMKPVWTGSAALVLGLALAASLSSTAYLGFAAYGLALALRMALAPGTIPLRKVIWLAAVALSGLAVVLTLAALSPAMGAAVGKIFAGQTFDKTQSLSAIQRGFWARQGIDAFVVSQGLGIGPGSFRSSSLATAVLGCMGLVGGLAFPLYCWRIFKPLRRSTWHCTTNPARAVGAAASWAALMQLVPLNFTAPSPDPGILWALFCGLAIGLRGDPGLASPGQISDAISQKLHTTVTPGADSTGRGLGPGNRENGSCG